MEPIMGNPASVTRKKTEKRRKKYEQRLGPGVYLPKDQRLIVNEAVKKHEAEAKAKAEKTKKERAAKKKAKPAAAPAAAPAKDEKK
jgi:hypothetical protein